MIPNLLSIAGSDPSGGAGIQADLKTFAALGGYGMAALSALTAQNTRGVTGVHVLPVEFLVTQLEAIYADIRVDAVKIGMLATGAMVAAVAERLAVHRQAHIVVDPVLVATSGDSLGSPDVVDAIRHHLLPLAAVVTPNLPEASRLADRPLPETEADMRDVAERIHALGAAAVLVKGGHLGGRTAVDVLFDGKRHRSFVQDRVDTRNTHGTGCTLSSAIAAGLARSLGLEEAVARAKAYLTEALRRSADLDVGSGHGPVHHMHVLTP